MEMRLSMFNQIFSNFLIAVKLMKINKMCETFDVVRAMNKNIVFHSSHITGCKNMMTFIQFVYSGKSIKEIGFSDSFI